MLRTGQNMTRVVAEAFRIVTVVWGNEFVDRFLDVCLASMLTEENLPYLAERRVCSFRIYTTAADVLRIRASHQYRRLARIMTVEIAEIAGISFVGKYRAVNDCHADFILGSAQSGAALVFVFPDVVWADGAGRRMFELVGLEGKRMGLVFTPRVVKETFLPALFEMYGDPGDGLRPIPRRGLVELSMKHLHREVTSMLWDPGSTNGVVSSGFYWQAKGGLLTHQFYLFPLVVVPDWSGAPVTAVDADYTLRACSDPDDIHVFDDSDELCLMDFTGASAFHPPDGGGAPTRAQMIDWASRHTHRRHRDFLRRGIRFHATDLTPDWEEVERGASAVVEALLIELDCVWLEPHVPSASVLRLLSPRYLLGKVRDTGVRGFLRQILAVAKRELERRRIGPELRIGGAVSGDSETRVP